MKKALVRYIPEEVHRGLKMVAAKEGKTLQEIYTEAFITLLKLRKEQEVEK